MTSAVTLAAVAASMFVFSGASLPAAATAPRLSATRTAAVTATGDAGTTQSTAEQIAESAPERAALAAKQKAASERRARNSGRAGRGGYASTDSANGLTVHVWTTGFQAQINECRGAVDLTAIYHTRAVGEHWSCGGAAFPEYAGAIVHFSGIDAGTYRVMGVAAILNAYTAHTNDLPHGYAMLFQTCHNNDSHTTIFIGLDRIG